MTTPANTKPKVPNPNDVNAIIKAGEAAQAAAAKAKELANAQKLFDSYTKQRKILDEWLSYCNQKWLPYDGSGGSDRGEKYVNLPPYKFAESHGGTANPGEYRWANPIRHIDDWLQGRIYFEKDLKKAISDWNNKAYAAHQKLIALQKKSTAGQVVGSGVGGGTDKSGAAAAAAKNITKKDLDKLPVEYNVGSVKEAYYRPRNQDDDSANGEAYMVHLANGKKVVHSTGFNDGIGLNNPSAIKNASELWSSAIGSKGMFQTYFPVNGWTGTNTDAASAFPKENAIKKYGFQFLYNPGTISMDYMGVQQTDVAYQMSGNDKSNYIPAQGNSGSISFDIMLNRMYDMKYYNTDGTLMQEAIDANVYSPRNPYGPEGVTTHKLFNEQQAIYNKGTMYDMEYLLRTLLGYTMKSSLRHEMTADMGLFSRRPVELHLGPKMRYRGYVNGISVRHIMFNERMVPMLSSVHISFNRYPDYPEAGSDWSLNGSAATSNTATSSSTASSATTANQKALKAGFSGRVQ